MFACRSGLLAHAASRGGDRCFFRYNPLGLLAELFPRNGFSLSHFFPTDLREGEKRFRHFGCRRCDRRSCAETLEGFFSFLAPLGPAEALRRGGIPAHRLTGVSRLLVQLGQLERDHAVSSLLIKQRELRGSVSRGSRFSDTRLDLSPVRHAVALYQPRRLAASHSRGAAVIRDARFPEAGCGTIRLCHQATSSE